MLLLVSFECSVGRCSILSVECIELFGTMCLPCVRLDGYIDFEKCYTFRADIINGVCRTVNYLHSNSCLMLN